MRELEFRAWCPVNKVMVGFVGKDLHDPIIACNFGDLMANEHENGKDLLMQYTGLKDKNGVKLFEGDIIITWGKPYIASDMLFVGHKIHECTLVDGDFEIIGNIHQNPELLPGNQKPDV